MKPDNAARIGKYLAGEMEPAELADFLADTRRDAALRDELAACTRIWHQEAPEPADNWDVGGAWDKVSADRQLTRSGHKGFALRKLWIPAAALVLLMIGIRVWRGPMEVNVYTAGSGGTEPVELADGSRVTLKAGSSLTEYHFGRRSRRVTLTGEAYFEVAPDASRPFYVRCGETLTEVVGTSFTIRQEADAVTIVVESGKVIFQADDDGEDSVALQAGEAAKCMDHRLQHIPNPSPNFTAWRTRELRFTGIPLEEAARDISAFFDTRVTIESGDSQCRITIPLPFREPDLTSVLRAVAVAVQAELYEKDGEYIIRGGRCR